MGTEDAVCGPLAYRRPEERDMPHVVKFSGGRSSASMLLSLARSGVLSPSRKDVVMFANTTAEHPATYEFAKRVCDEVEAEHGIPCLWYEYCTYEAASRTGWARRGGYRLVTREPRSAADPPDAPGYSSDGSSFEALASVKAMLPNRSLRFCTQELKVLPGIALLSEWFSGGPGPAHLGHYHDSPQTSAHQAAGRYSGSKMSPERYEAMAQFAHSQDPSRPEQRWEDFTSVEVETSGVRGPRADLYGRTASSPFRYLTLLGLRADETKRVVRSAFDAMLADGAVGSSCRRPSHPAGESVACPLHDQGVGKEGVDGFWSRQPYDLSVDGRWGNCVFCPMKGEAALRELVAEGGTCNATGGPESISWWADVESRYGRGSDDGSVGSFRFLSLRSPTYAEIASDPSPRPGTRTDARPCACSD